MGEGGCIITPSFTSRTLRIMSVATKHTGHDRFIASRGAIPSQISPLLFTELRTSRMTLRVHVGVSEFLLPVTPGQAGSAPAESSIEFRFLAKSALFYCVFLRRLSRNKARFLDDDGVKGSVLEGNGFLFSAMENDLLSCGLYHLETRGRFHLRDGVFAGI